MVRKFSSSAAGPVLAPGLRKQTQASGRSKVILRLQKLKRWRCILPTEIDGIHFRVSMDWIFVGVSNGFAGLCERHQQEIKPQFFCSAESD
jgi:hypothetical protein